MQQLDTCDRYRRSSKTLKPSIGLMRDIRPRWSYSTMLFKYRVDRSRVS